MEYHNTCQFSPAEVLAIFDNCERLNGDGSKCGSSCEVSSLVQKKGSTLMKKPVSVADLKPGQSGRVVHVNAVPAIRQRLLDMGVLTNIELTVERVAPSGDPVWIRLHNYQLALRRKEAAGVFVVPVEIDAEAV